MRIALATDDDRGLDATLSHHFGRCPYYVFVDLEGREIKRVQTLPNPFYVNHGQPGQVPSFIHKQGAQVIIAGGMGPRALDFFGQFGIVPITKVSGKVKDVLASYLDGQLTGAAPCDEHQDQARARETSPPSNQSENDEISRLKEEMVALRQQLVEVQNRLTKLTQELGPKEQPVS